MADVDLNAPVNAVQAQKASTQGLLANQDLKTNDFLGRYTNTLGGQEKTGALAARLGQELGVPQLQQNANMLRDTVTNLPGTYSKATTGFDVNANQLQRVITQKTGEIAPAMETAERALSTAQDNLNTRLGYETRDQDRELMAYDKEQEFLSDRLARETTLYSQDNENELSALLAKMSAGVTLSEGEKNRANQLAMQERDFENQKKLYAEQAKYSSSNDPYVSVGEGSAIYNTSTGKMEYKNPKTYQASGGSSDPYAYLGGGSDWY